MLFDLVILFAKLPDVLVAFGGLECSRILGLDEKQLLNGLDKEAELGPRRKDVREDDHEHL